MVQQEACKYPRRVDPHHNVTGAAVWVSGYLPTFRCKKGRGKVQPTQVISVVLDAEQALRATSRLRYVWRKKMVQLRERIHPGSDRQLDKFGLFQHSEPSTPPMEKTRPLLERAA